MKNGLIMITLLVFSTTLFAQQFEVSEAERPKIDGTFNSFLIELPNVSRSQAEEDWKKFFKDYKGKTRKSIRKYFWLTQKAILPGFSSDPVNFHSCIVEESTPIRKTTVTVWFETTEGYVNSKENRTQGIYATKLLNDFAIIVSKNQAEEVAKAEEDQLNNMVKELKKLEKANKKFNKEIKEAKENIVKNEKNLEINELDQKKKLASIEAQKERILVAKQNVKKFDR